VFIANMGNSPAVGGQKENFFAGLASFAAGAVGAAVSVMSRMTTGKLYFRYEADNSQIRLFGVFRVLIGAIFGFILYAVLASGIIPLVNLSMDQPVLFYTVVGFLAGFSERWAQNMLTTASSNLLPASTKDSKDSPAVDE
jgi:hypothetical protein